MAALTKFLFTSKQNQTAISAAAAGARRGSASALGGVTDFASEGFSSAGDDISRPSGLGIATGLGIGAGTALGSGLGYLVAGPAWGLSRLVELISGTIGDKMLYSEMYLNPESLDIKYNIPTNKKETQGGVILHHWRPELPEISFKGAVGWIRNEAILDSAIDNAARSLASGGSSIGDAFSEPFGGDVSTAWTDMTESFDTIALQRFRESIRNLSNSPRKFLQEIKELALSPMYFESGGMEIYNTKKIVAFTKQYPEGVALEGYFKDFHIGEAGKDAETIKYNFSFVATNLGVVTLMDRLGQFLAPFYGALRDTLSPVGNILSSTGIAPSLGSPSSSAGAAASSFSGGIF